MSPVRTEAERRKRNLIIICAVLVFLVTMTAVQVGVRGPELPVANNLVVFALFNLNLVVFLLLLILLFRNLVKLYFERRNRVLGSRFKAKLVVAFLSLALAPAILIFLVASNLITTSIDGWFKVQVERPLDESLDVARAVYQTTEDNAIRHGQYISRVITRDGLLAEERREALIDFLMDQQEQYGLAVITIFGPTGRELVHVKDPVLPPMVSTFEVNHEQVRQSLGGKELSTVKEIANGDLIQGMVPILASFQDRRVVAAVVTAYHMPQRLEAKVREISRTFQEYKQLKLLKRPIKGSYILLFLLMTLIIVFSATWFGLYLARGITVPIQMLAEGTREVAAGNLAYRVDAKADDEIGILVDSFNKMTEDLAQSKARLEEAYLDLQQKSGEMDQRRRYTETVLEAVATGVISLDEAGRITTVNRAAAQLLALDPDAITGRPVVEALPGPGFGEMVALVQKMDRVRRGSLEREVRLSLNGTGRTFLASLTALEGPDGSYLGMVLVFDDLTELLKAQRMATWREVAQRIAHEIKNPLTPIQLSAQRLRRRLANRAPEDSRELLAECTGTIIEEVEGLKRLVDEFTRFARMPALAPRPTDLSRLVESVAALYAESHPAVKIRTASAPDLPLCSVDPEQIKRVLTNLVDNAVEADTTEITIETRWSPSAGAVWLRVGDNGEGIPPENREKLFLPYFSTKATGMGLGLAIVGQILSDHGGKIRVEENHPGGSVFVVELPLGDVARASAQES